MSGVDKRGELSRLGLSTRRRPLTFPARDVRGAQTPVWPSEPCVMIPTLPLCTHEATASMTAPVATVQAEVPSVK